MSTKFTKDLSAINIRFKDQPAPKEKELWDYYFRQTPSGIKTTGRSASKEEMCSRHCPDYLLWCGQDRAKYRTVHGIDKTYRNMTQATRVTPVRFGYILTGGRKVYTAVDKASPECLTMIKQDESAILGKLRTTSVSAQQDLSFAGANRKIREALTLLIDRCEYTPKLAKITPIKKKRA